MNVSFSTRGWQQIPWEQQVQMAETMRFGGVELYNVHKTPELTGRAAYDPLFSNPQPHSVKPKETAQNRAVSAFLCG